MCRRAVALCGAAGGLRGSSPSRTCFLARSMTRHVGTDQCNQKTNQPVPAPAPGDLIVGFGHSPPTVLHERLLPVATTPPPHKHMGSAWMD